MPILFPNSPSLNQEVSVDDTIWYWDGSVWNIKRIAPIGPTGPTGPTGPVSTLLGPTGPTGSIDLTYASLILR